jgi:hypothetical protein
MILQAWDGIVDFDEVFLCTSGAHGPASPDGSSPAPGHREIAAGIAEYPSPER